jgi:hypothetical protein
MLALLILAAVGASAQSPSGLRILSLSGNTASLSQYGITWEFSEEVEYGTYANGDYWVVGPVDIVSIDPASDIVDSRVVHGSMLNPPGGLSVTGFDSGGGAYDDAYNVAMGVTDNNPLQISSGSLVSCISDFDPDTYALIDTFAVLTVVASPPPAESFRPPYSGTDKVARFTFNDVDTSLLPTLSSVGSPPSFTTLESMIRRPYIDFFPGWKLGDVLSNNHNGYHYGRDLSVMMGAVALKLSCNYSLEQKRPLLVYMIQRGIDLYGIYTDYANNNRTFPWGADGGHKSGRKLPVLFAGVMLDDQDMKGFGTIPERIQEDDQTFHVSQTSVDGTTSGMTEQMKTDVQSNDIDVWNQFVSDYPTISSLTGDWRTDPRAGGYHPYFSDNIGMPEWSGGDRDNNLPYNYNRYWGHPYRVLNGASWGGYALAARILIGASLWNHDAFFDYVHRYMAMTNGDQDPFAVSLGYPEVPGRPTLGQRDGWRSWNQDGRGYWGEVMFDQYWDNYYTQP